jgi:hypothetical protein
MDLIKKINYEIEKYIEKNSNFDENEISNIINKKNFYDKGICFGALNKGFIYFDVLNQNWNKNIFFLNSTEKSILKKLKKEAKIFNWIKEYSQNYNFYALPNFLGFDIKYKENSNSKEILVSALNSNFISINNIDFIKPLSTFEKKDQFLKDILEKIYLKDF